MWTVLFVVANQIAYTVVVRIASSRHDQRRRRLHGGRQGTGYTVYSGAFLLVDGAARDHHGLAGDRGAAAVLGVRRGRRPARPRPRGRRHVRSTYALVLPASRWSRWWRPTWPTSCGATAPASEAYDAFVPTLSLFAVGLFFFTTHYLMLRGFYALEQNRRVFFIQCAVAATNIVRAVAAHPGSTRRRRPRPAW